MLNLLFAAGALSALATSVAANQVAPGVVGYEFTKQRARRSDFPHLDRRGLLKRANTVQAGLSNELSLYLINVCGPTVWLLNLRS